MTRKQVKAILDNLGVTNPFRLKTVGFSDIARGQVQVVTILNWQPDPKADEVKSVFREHGIIAEFDY